MIKYLKKDITTIENGLILQGVNTRGVMGAGVALAIMNKWPEVYEAFIANGVGANLLGTTYFVHLNAPSGVMVANGYTQEFYGSDGKRYADLNAVSNCIFNTLLYCDSMSFDLYMPKIGCGLGGLSWENEVKPLVEKVSAEFPRVNIFICDI